MEAQGEDDQQDFPKPWLYNANLLITLQTSYDKLFHTVIFVKYMKPFISPMLKHPTSRQVIFALIGNQMVREHYGGYPNTPQILYPPFMADDMRRKMLDETRTGLAAHICESAKEMDFHSEPTLSSFAETISRTYENELRNFRALKKSRAGKGRSEKPSFLSGSNDGAATVKGGGSSNANGSSNGDSFHAEGDVSTYDEAGAALESMLDHTAFTIKPQSIPENIKKFFKRSDCSAHEKIFSKIVGRIFPRPLRSYLYKCHLMKRDKKNYAALIRDACAEKNMADPSKTSIDFLLTHSLKTAFHESIGIFDDRKFERGRRVLNMYYTLTGKNSVQLSYVILPFLRHFQSLDEHRIVGLLGRFANEHMSLPTAEVAAAAQSLLSTIDPDLHVHLGDTFLSNSGFSDRSTFNSAAKKIEALFREMVDICFVPLLNETQLDFVWDHNFLFGWRESCCALL